MTTIAMTRTIHAKEFQIHSIAVSCGVTLETLQGSPRDAYVKVDVDGSPESVTAFREALEARFGFTQVWETKRR